MRRTSGGLAAAVAIFVGLLAAVPSAARPPAPPVTVLVHGAGGSIEAALGALGSARLPVVHPMKAIGVAVTTGPASLLSQLSTDSRVERVEPAPPPMEFDLNTSRRSIRLDDAASIQAPGPEGFGIPYDGSGISIAVIDTGIDATHPMFQRLGRSTVVRNIEFACFDRPTTVCAPGGERTFVDSPTGDSDGVLGGHGTHVASTAAGQRITTQDGRTLTGVAPGASLVGISVSAELVTWAGVAALNWVAENHAAPCGARVPAATCPPIRVVNNSWGYPDEYDPETALHKAIARVVGAGVVIAQSAGNSGEDPDEARTRTTGHSPVEGIISTASYNDSDRGGRDGHLSSFSSRGLQGEFRTYPDLSAPGDSISAACRPYLAICSTGADLRDPNYNTISGTSMASPHTAGAAAVLLQANPRLKPADVERILEASAYEFRSRGKYEPDPAHPGGRTSYDKGHGLLDVAAALAMATGKPNPPVRTYPDAYRPPTPKGAASVSQAFDWKGGPLAGTSLNSCAGKQPNGGCELTGVRLTVPDGGADVSVTIDPVGTPVGVELIGPDGSVAAGDYYVDGVGKKTIDATVFPDGVYTVAVWALSGATATYTGSLSLTEMAD